METQSKGIPSVNRPIVKRKKLVMISHTEHYSKNREIVGWAPTVNEINYLADYWDEVVHVACLYDTEAPLSSKPYKNDNTRLVPIRPTGGKRIWDKLDIIFHMPAVLGAVAQAIQGASEVQFRAPTGIGVYLLPAFSFLFKRDFFFWVKYAGNWGAVRPPSGYRFQRWWLKKNLAKCKVTINGSWLEQPEHCISFENPCLTGDDLAKGSLIRLGKKFEAPFRLAFVGRLEDEKGLSRIIDALKIVGLNQIERIDFVGDGPKRREYERQCAFVGNKVFFHGFLDSSGVHSVLAEAHFILLPSDSEGFPKVIAEAACYGGIPIVSDVGSIGHYVKSGTNGFLWDMAGVDLFSTILERALSTNTDELERKSQNIRTLAETFTFEHYQRKLETQVFLVKQ
jgi:glycosyltransferase involved in cell wall biosynthesis